MSASPTGPLEQLRMPSHPTTSWDDDDKILREDEISTPNGIERFFVASDHGRIFSTTGGVEPSAEPCTDDIPWDDLVFWLGNSTTGEVDCSCATCQFERSQGRVPVALVSGESHAAGQPPAGHGHYVYIPSSFYKRLSAMIPVISVPRIEGVN